MPRARRTAVRQPTVERKIYFYRCRSDHHEAGPDFDARTVANHIGQLQFANGERYVSLPAGNSLCVWPDCTPTRVRLRMGVTRRSGLPEVEDGGALMPLSIPDTAGLSEATHIVFFPKAIIGAEFNFYAPRLTRLSTYIQEKCDGTARPVYFDLLLRKDVQQQLKNMHDIRMLQLRLHRAYLDLADEADASLGAS